VNLTQPKFEVLQLYLKTVDELQFEQSLIFGLRVQFEQSRLLCQAITVAKNNFQAIGICAITIRAVDPFDRIIRSKVFLAHFSDYKSFYVFQMPKFYSSCSVLLSCYI
jgi:hypothetical protein